MLFRTTSSRLSANDALWPCNEKRPNTFKRNIVYLTQGELLIPIGEHWLNDRLAAREPLGTWDENVYWHTGGADRLRFYRRTFAQWQELGLDKNSLIADPRFVDAAHRDFRLKPDSPALTLGFQPFDISSVGLHGDPAWVSEASHSKCPVIALPPPPAPPAPLQIDDDFETTPVGRHPAHARVSGEEQGASITVSDEKAARGKHALKVVDSKALEPSWQPHFYYEPHITEGLVRQSFDAWLEPAAQFFTEWRDTTAYPRNVGPSVQLEGNGHVSAGGARLATLPTGRWVHVEVEARLGKKRARTFQLTLSTPDAPAQRFDKLPITGADFHELNWLGFSSTALQDTVFFLDNIQIQRAGADR